MRRLIVKLRKFLDIWILGWVEWCRNLLHGRNMWVALSFILQPIWQAMHLNCHFHFGKLLKFMKQRNIHLKWVLFSSIRFPFEWRNPIGYTVAVSLQCIVITYTFFTMMTMLVIGIASYSFGISLTEDLKYILHSIEEKSKLRKNRPYLYRQFIEFIILQSDTMQLSR